MITDYDLYLNHHTIEISSRQQVSFTQALTMTLNSNAMITAASVLLTDYTMTRMNVSSGKKPLYMALSIYLSNALSFYAINNGFVHQLF
jgi:hypothetical protein